MIMVRAFLEEFCKMNMINMINMLMMMMMIIIIIINTT